MSLELVTGKWGEDHIKSEQVGSYNAGITGSGRYVLDRGEKFNYEIINNNLIRIKNGDAYNQGRHIFLKYNDYIDVVIENGTQSEKRFDLIVFKYKKDTETGHESVVTTVIKGTPGDIANDPEYINGDILNGDIEDDMLMYRVYLNGLNIESVEPLFDTFKSMKNLNDIVDEAKIEVDRVNETVEKNKLDISKNAESITSLNANLKTKAESIDLQRTNINVKDLIVFRTFTGSLSLSGGEIKEKVVSGATPSGYKILGVVHSQVTNTSNCLPYCVGMSGENIDCYVRNTTSGTTYTANIQVTVAYIRNI